MKSFVTLPPTHFATIQPTLGMGNSAFLKATVKFLRALKYRALKRRVKFAYLISREYVKGALHCHGLLRAGRMPRRMVRESKTVARVRVSMKPVRNVIGAAKYVVKDTRNPFKKPELAPPGRTRLLLVSRGFLSASWKVLWQQIQAERAARPEGQVRHV